MSTTVIIPSATLVPEELQNLGKLPAIIYPIDQRLVFDYLNEQYQKKCEQIKVLLYENADKVHRRLKRYENKKVLLYDIPMLSDLGHTIYYGIQDMSGEIIINFADTIVSDALEKLQGDSYIYAEDFFSDTWTYFEEKDGRIEQIFDKVSAKNNRNEKGKLFAGVFRICDSRFFGRCLEKAFEGYDEQVSTFYYALRLYSQKYPMKPVETDHWFDIGHADKYYNAKLEVKARSFNHISIDKNRGILRKFSDDKDKFIGEIKWYLKLPSDIEYVRPRIFDYSTSYENPYVAMEYYAYHTIHELFLYGDLTYHQWRDIFDRIRFVCEDFRRYSVCDKNIVPALEDMYLTKTIQRMDILRREDHFKAFFDKTILINGKRYKSLDQIISILRVQIPKMLYDVDEFHIIHGDLCFANIMIDNNFSFIKVIDPRGKFGSYDLYGDTRYELAKLFHSIDGKYDFIIKDLFETEYDLSNACITYSISDRKRDFNLFEIFKEVFEEEIGTNLNKIELIEALLFLSMIPLHKESMEHQLVMLATGLDILDRILDIREEDS